MLQSTSYEAQGEKKMLTGRVEREEKYEPAGR